MKKTLLVIFASCFVSITNAQSIAVNQGLTPYELLNQVFNGLGVTISNVTVNGSSVNANVPIANITRFSNINVQFPFSDGLLLTTGNGFGAVGPNDEISSWENTPPTSDVSSDPNLTAIANGQLYNGVVLEFDFVPSGDTVLFHYVFGSEEYPEFSPGNYNDAFGLFLWGPGISGQYPLGGFASGGVNLAVLPDGTPVTINTVGDETNTQFYVANDNGLAYGSAIQYDGTTVVLDAGASVSCGQLYHMKFAIGNVGDQTWDSGLFLQAGSFSSTTYLNTSALINYITPICLPANNEPVSLSGTGSFSGGSYASNPVGLALDPSTGEITPNSSSVGEYKVVYTTPVVNNCNASSMVIVRILNDAILPIPEICGVGLDSLTQKNRIVWEKPPFIGIDSFFVFKETASNVFAQIGSLNYYDTAVFIDMNSSPLDSFYRYKLSMKGYCGTETAMSTIAHKTVMLDVTPGAGGVFDLSWNPYEGFPYSTYNLYRGSDPSNITQIATLPSSVTTYQDNNPPAGALFYQIEVVNPNDCNPTKINGYGVSRSNIASNGIASVGEEEESIIAIYPNPTFGDITLNASKGLIGKQYVILDAAGRRLRTGFINELKQTISLNQVDPGTYFIAIEHLGKLLKFITE
jgi:hypothetical protein